MSKILNLQDQLKAAGMRLSGQWADIHGVVPYSPKTLLYGPPGTGKTSAAYYGADGTCLDPATVHVLECHDELMVAEAIGHFVRIADRTVYFAGPIAQAFIDSWKGETVLLIDEIDLAGMALLSKLRGALNDPRNARLAIPSKKLATASPAEIQALMDSGEHVEVLRPHPTNLRVVATMNGERDDLDGPLWDRFKSYWRVQEIHPGALARLPEWMRDLARDTALIQDQERRISVRSWITLAEDFLPNLPVDLAFRAVFEDRADDVRAAVQAKLGGPIPDAKTPAPASVAAAPEVVPPSPATTPAMPVNVGPVVPVSAPAGPMSLADVRAAGYPVAFRTASKGAGRPPKPVCHSCGNDRQSNMDAAPGGPLKCGACASDIYPAGGYTVRFKNPDTTADKNRKWLPVSGF